MSSSADNPLALMSGQPPHVATFQARSPPGTAICQLATASRGPVLLGAGMGLSVLSSVISIIVPSLQARLVRSGAIYSVRLVSKGAGFPTWAKCWLST